MPRCIALDLIQQDGARCKIRFDGKEEIFIPIYDISINPLYVVLETLKKEKVNYKDMSDEKTPFESSVCKLAPKEWPEIGGLYSLMIMDDNVKKLKYIVLKSILYMCSVQLIRGPYETIDSLTIKEAMKLAENSMKNHTPCAVEPHNELYTFKKLIKERVRDAA